MRFILFCLFFLCGVTHANPDAKGGMKLGTGFSTSTINGVGIGVDLVSPTLLSFSNEKQKVRTAFSVYLDAGVDFVANPNAHNIPLGLGLRGSLVPESGPISPYTKIGFELVVVDSAVSATSTSSGTLVAFGCDLFYAKDANGFLGTSDSSFFVEANVHLAFKNIASGAFSGVTPRMGFRSHF